jgi:SAM-dependent methyltransferase
MTHDDLLAAWRHEEQEPFSGWDFSYLDGRHWTNEVKSWSYMDRAAELLQHAKAAIDLDTGGGEKLLELRQHWPPKLCATESYPPNVKLATERLSPLGVRVFDVEMTNHGPVPFSNGEFDLVLNRHGGFNPSEVGRILAPGGTFLTQQVHVDTNCDLRIAFDADLLWPDAHPGYYVPRLEAAGMQMIDVQESTGKHGFNDVGALVFYLKVIPWTVPGFSVETHRDYLFTLKDKLDRGQPLAFEWKSYLIEARRQP